MNAFEIAALALFADPNLAEDGVWYPGGDGAGRALRVIRVPARALAELGNASVLDAGVLLDVLIDGSDLPAEGDTISVGGVLHRIQAPPLPSFDGRILRLDVLRV